MYCKARPIDLVFNIVGEVVLLVMAISKHYFIKLRRFYKSFVQNQWFRVCIKLPESRDFSKRGSIPSKLFETFQNMELII